MQVCYCKSRLKVLFFFFVRSTEGGYHYLWQDGFVEVLVTCSSLPLTGLVFLLIVFLVSFIIYLFVYFSASVKCNKTKLKQDVLIYVIVTNQHCIHGATNRDGQVVRDNKVLHQDYPRLIFALCFPTPCKSLSLCSTIFPYRLYCKTSHALTSCPIGN